MSELKTKVTPAILEQVALLEVAGETTRSISEKTGLSLWQVRNIASKEEYKKIVKNLQDEIFETEKRRLRAAFAKMTDSAIRVLEANMDENNLESLKYYFKVMGIGVEEKQTGDTTIQVMLPGGAESVAIETSGRKIEEADQGE